MIVKGSQNTWLVVVFLFVFLMICVFGSNVSYSQANSALTSVVNSIGSIGEQWFGYAGDVVEGESTVLEVLFGWFTEFFSGIFTTLIQNLINALRTLLNEIF